jgi:hypothetical protein
MQTSKARASESRRKVFFIVFRFRLPPGKLNSSHRLEDSQYEASALFFVVWTLGADPEKSLQDRMHPR